MRPEDWDVVARPFISRGIVTGNSTFEQSAPIGKAGTKAICHLADWWRAWQAKSGASSGLAALSPVSRRQVYAGVAEFSVYVAERARRPRDRAALLQALIEESERQGHLDPAGRNLPGNTASWNFASASGSDSGNQGRNSVHVKGVGATCVAGAAE